MPFDPEAATAAWLATLSPEAIARSNAYFEGGYWLLLWDFLLSLGLAWLLLSTRWSARIRDFAERCSRFRWIQTLLYAIAYLVLTTLITLPWSGYEGWYREHQYGLSTQDLGAWLTDAAKGLLITLILGGAAVTIVYAVIRRSPRRWWLWGTGVAVAFLVFELVIGPTVLEPVFNDFKPLPEGPLKERILSIARANAVPATQVYQYDASKQTTRISAHVSGIFGTAQISLNDNLLTRGTPDEVVAVLGHEMGHYVLGHSTRLVIDFGLLAIFAFAFMAWGSERLLSRFKERWGLRDAGDVAGLPLLMALASVFAFAVTPITNTVSRSIEVEADAFGLNAARQPDGFARAAVQLSEYRKMHPGPLEEFVFFDHPSGWNRVHRAMIWKAENLEPTAAPPPAAEATPGGVTPPP